jgi:peroxiredoxin
MQERFSKAIRQLQETKQMPTPNRRSPALALMLALLVALVSVAQVASARAPQDASSAAAPLRFRLRTIEGGEISAGMLRGDIVLLAFGASSLPPSLSRAQAQGVQKVADQYAERNVRVYWVSTDSDSPKSKSYATDTQLRDYAKKYGLKVGMLRDPEGVLLKELRVDQLPAIVILDQKGNISVPIVGGFDPRGDLADQLGKRLDTLLGASN